MNLTQEAREHTISAEVEHITSQDVVSRKCGSKCRGKHQHIHNHLKASVDVFAERVVESLMAGDEYIVVGGKKEQLGVLVSRLSPSLLYKMIRKMKVK